MNISILIVEDDDDLLDDAELLIKGLTDEQKREAQIEEIKIDKANCISAAERLLQAAASGDAPYDLLLLDLSLPNALDEPDNVHGGLNLLSAARESATAREVIVVSANVNRDAHITESFKRGATDFIRKPYSPIEYQQKVLNAVGLLREEYLSKLRKLLDERIPVLSASVWRSTAHQFSTRIYELIQAVVYESEELRREFYDRFAIENPQDPLHLHLAAIDRAIEEAREDFTFLQNRFDESGDNAEEIIIVQELRNLAGDLKPCLAVGVAAALGGETRVLSFHDNVRTVLKEILTGGLSEAANSTRTWQVEVEIENSEGMAILHINDNFPSIETAAAERINQGETLSPQDARSRQWGLSLAQHVALRGGGRLIVEPRDVGNLITYLIPLA